MQVMMASKVKSAAKVTNKNQGIDIDKAYIICQDSQILIEVMFTPFPTPFRLFVTS